MSDSNVYEMLWDCEYCGTEKLLGLTHRYCPNCGASQDPDTRYFPSDEEKVAVEDHEYVGVDVTCAACSKLNSAKNDFCTQCGAPLTDAAKAKMLASQTRRDGERFQSSGSRDIVKEQFDAEMARVGVKKEKAKKKKSGGINIKGVALIAVILAIIAGAVALLNWTEEAELIVTGHEWERSVDVQRYDTVRVDSWRDSRPSGDNASIIFGSCREEQRSTRRIPDGEECTTRRIDQGDGTFREERECRTKYREEPVYDDMCTWEVDRWEYERTASTDGTLSIAPFWPETNIRSCATTRIGCERETNRRDDYIVIFTATDGNETYRCDFSQGEWADIDEGSRWIGEVRVVDSGALLCDTLQRN